MRWAALLLLVAMALVVAQSSCTDDDPECSTGPAYPRGTQFPQHPFAHGGDRGCRLRCEYDAGPVSGAFYPIEALPSGPCDDDGYECSIPYYDGCGHQGAGCECKDGQWQCFIASAAAVTCPPRDAGVDSSVDANPDAE